MRQPLSVWDTLKIGTASFFLADDLVNGAYVFRENAQISGRINNYMETQVPLKIKQKMHRVCALIIVTVAMSCQSRSNTDPRT